MVVIPFQAKCLTPEEIGVWYVFMSLGSFAIMTCSGGFSPVIQRFTSYLFAGAQRLTSMGVPTAADLQVGQEDEEGRRTRILSFSRSIKIISLLLASVLVVILAAVGFIFIAAKVHDEPLRSQACFAWALNILGLAIMPMAGGLAAICQGYDKFTESMRILFVSRIASIFTMTACLWGGMGIWSLGIGTLIMGLVQYAGHQWLFAAIVRQPSPRIVVGSATSTLSEVFFNIWPTAWRFSLVTMGAWMITVSSTMMIGWTVGLVEAGSFGATAQILQFCVAVAGAWMTAAMPTFAKMRMLNQVSGLRSLFIRRWLQSISTYIALTGTALLAAQPLLELLGSNLRMIDGSLPWVLALVILLELNHGQICAGFLMTANIVPFTSSAIISGFMVVAGGVLLATTTTLGVWSFVIAQGVVQLLYNNWKWPLEVARDFRRLHRLEIFPQGP